ncbi:MAG: AAA family ATPase [Syntrophaceticus sp.]
MGKGAPQAEPLRTTPNRKKQHTPNDDKRLKPESVLQELNGLIGLSEVKKLVSEVSAYVQIQHRREKASLHTEQLVLHMIFKGNPGTGKTTIARIMGKLLYSMEVLSQGHLIEVERADLVGEYIGHTAHKTREQIKKAMGGILFIDEAYSLARGGTKDFGKESIDVLVKAMEDYKQDFVLILAGYKREMEWFLHSNPGLYSRFPIYITFPDYTVEELLQIGALMLKQRQYRLLPEARTVLRKILEEKNSLGSENEGNARLVRNLIEKAIRRQAVRLVKRRHLTREELMLIRPEDFD